jgi:hypothetical protein
MPEACRQGSHVRYSPQSDDLITARWPDFFDAEHEHEHAEFPVEWQVCTNCGDARKTRPNYPWDKGMSVMVSEQAAQRATDSGFVAGHRRVEVVEPVPVAVEVVEVVEVVDKWDGDSGDEHQVWERATDRDEGRVEVEHVEHVEVDLESGLSQEDARAAYAELEREHEVEVEEAPVPTLVSETMGENLTLTLRVAELEEERRLLTRALERAEAKLRLIEIARHISLLEMEEARLCIEYALEPDFSYERNAAYAPVEEE